MGTYREWLFGMAVLIATGVVIHLIVALVGMARTWLAERRHRTHDDLLAARREYARRLTNERRGNPPAWWQ